jgi:hypothetical protein
VCYDFDTPDEVRLMIYDMKDNIKELKEDKDQLDRRLDRAVSLLDRVNQTGEIYSTDEEDEDEE